MNNCLHRSVIATLAATVITATDSSLYAGSGSLTAVAAVAVAGQLGGGYNERRTCDNLVKRGREMLGKNNLELAAWYLEKAEKLNVDYDGVFNRFKDSPAKLRADVNQAIAANQRTAAITAPLPSASGLPSASAQSPLPSNLATQAEKNGMPATPSQRFQPTPVSTSIPDPVAAIPSAIPQSPIGSEPTFDPLTIDPNDIGDTSLTEMTNVSKGRAVRYLQQAREALDNGNQVAALGYFRASVTCGATFTAADNDSPNRLAIDLQKAGVDASRLRMENLSPPALDPNSIAAAGPLQQLIPSTSPAPKAGMWQEKRDEVVKKLAQATAAIDRGDLKTAEKLALEAQDLRVPDEAFQPKDKRPWMVLMDVSRRQNRVTNPTASNFAETNVAGGGKAKIGLVAGEEPIEDLPLELPEGAPLDDSAEFDAGIINQSPDPSPAELNELAPMRDRSFTQTPPSAKPQPIPVSAESLREPKSSENIVEVRDVPHELPSQIITSPQAAAPTNGARRLFDQGVTALKEHNSERAWRLFVEAWQRADELDEVTRDRLQGYLQSFAATANEDSSDESRVADAGAGNSGLDAREQEALSKFIGEVTREQAAIHRLREEQPTEAWDRLKSLRQKVATAEINESSRDRLVDRVDRSLLELESYIETNRPRIELDERNNAVLAEVKRRREQRVRDQGQLAEFVDQFNTLMDQQRYSEAEIVAKKAREIAPTSPVTQNMTWKTQFARQMVTNITRNERFSNRAMQALDSVVDAAVPFPDNVVQEFPDARVWSDLTASRKQLLQDNKQRYSDSELEIQQALSKKVDANFDGEPLYTVLDSLAKMAGINLFLDPQGLDAHGVTPETPITIALRKPVMLKSALNLILEPLELSYVVENDVLRITSELVRDGAVFPKTYPVADLVYPIPNFAPSYDMGLPGAMRQATMTAAEGRRGLTNDGNNHENFNIGPMPQGAVGMPSSAGALAQMGQAGMLDGFGPSYGGNSPVGYGPGGPGGGSQADFDTLMELITTTVEPETWEEMGGTGTLAPFPTNLSLVVSQTQEIHEKVADLLAQLRRLQDLQVTIEVRFITLNDDFFEKIGVDFDFEVDDNTGLSANDAARLAGVQGNFDDSGPSVTVGLDPLSGLPRADLDLRFDQKSFGAVPPQFGGYDSASSAANIGFAILSDIEAFFIIEAAQGDRRSNVLQAPKVTLFNGQQAFISDASQRPFVTSVIPVVGDFAAAHQPVITVLTEGTSLSVQAIVSSDRRFVRLTLVPFFSRIGDVDTFQFNGRTDSDSGTNALDPSDDTGSVTNNIRTINEGTTVQLPTFAFTTVNTTVSVPDGGTILLGGIKRLSEGRNEAGVPVLSKLPYINRLFRNVSIGRETSSLMMMVTPRIIIQEEEEANVLGGISGN